MRSMLVILILLGLVPGAGAQTPATDDDRAPSSPGAFWAAAGDPTLGRLIEVALERNPDLRAVDARVDVARADRLAATLDLAPAVTARGGYTRQQMSGASFPGLGGSLPEQDLWEAGVQLSWELDAFGRVRRSLQGRSALLDATEEEVDDTRLLLAAEVADAYFRFRGEENRLAVARRNAENQRRTLTVTRERLDGGRGTALDTERASAQLSSTLAIISGLEASMTAARLRLASLIGGDPAPMLETPAAPFELPALAADAASPRPEELVRQRPDLRGAEQRLAASEAFVGAARADYLPRISVQGAAGYTAGAFDDLGRSGTPRYAFGPVISWPLLDLGRVKARVDGARAEQAEARARYDAAVLRAVEEVGTSRVAYSSALERLRHLEDAATASERATELARLRFEEGATDFLEVLDAERRQLEAQDRLATGRTEAANALVALYRATGGEGWSP